MLMMSKEDTMRNGREGDERDMRGERVEGGGEKREGRGERREEMREERGELRYEITSFHRGETIVNE